MRVISGSARGLKLASLEGENTRPTLDRVKEALFSMLTPYLASARVLDLFAGSGALGIEALSRGAESAVFVDNFPEALDVVKKNVSRASFIGRSKFSSLSALDFLRRTDEVFDILFLDPPYSSELYIEVLKTVAQRSLLSPGGVVSVEWDSKLERPNIPQEFEIIRDRRYGRVMLTLASLSAPDKPL